MNKLKRFLIQRPPLAFPIVLVLIANCATARENASFTNGWSFQKGDPTNGADTKSRTWAGRQFHSRICGGGGLRGCG